jgi:hypothetical protein
VTVGFATGAVGFGAPVMLSGSEVAVEDELDSVADVVSEVGLEVVDKELEASDSLRETD